ncbi:MAG: molybdopterin oxidoreductase family protein [Halomonadaceae bacterium]|nr:MAG: molybdopterin oxidoreductase family protein [Halomonadaceae bacterium]
MLENIRKAKADAARATREQAQLPVKTHFRSCTLCEAMCGVKIEYQGDTILSIAGDPDDPHSQGHICPKGYALQDLHNDPDRLKMPLEKVDGEWHEIDWDSALDKIAQRLTDIQAEHGNDAVGGYWGNPASHNLGLLMGASGLRKTLGSGNMFTAASLDQMPHQLVSYLMFGHSNLFTIPDIDRTDYMLMLGANPAVSNGSLMTAGDILKRLEAIQTRGGKVVLIDPRRTESARYVSEHLFIQPAKDALFLVGLIQHIIHQGLCKADHLLPLLDGGDELLTLFGDFPLAEISRQCGIPVDEIKRIAEEFAGAESAVCYGRMGVSTQSFGALNHWLMLVLNILTGNLDRAGGMMFTTPAFDKSLKRPMGSFGSYKSRVRGLPEFERTLPSAVIAEEMLTPGDGQIRAFLCVAGNPVLSTPNGRQMDQALEQLDFMVSIDFYLNETSRHADIILPPTGTLEHEQYDLVFNLLAVRNLARFSKALFEPAEGTRSDWDIVWGLTSRIAALKYPDLQQAGAGGAPSPEAILDQGLRTGPYGQGFTEYNSGEPVAHDEGLSLEVLKRYPHGLDLGPLQPNFPRYLFTENGKIHAAPAPLVEDLQRLRTEFGEAAQAKPLLLIGRRDLRTNNSWMHNSQRLIKGKNRCDLFVHPEDAARLGLRPQGQARISSRVGELEVTVSLNDDIMPGVVCLPHGWGHNRDGMRLSVAESKPGISVNDITDDQLVDALSGNAVLNGIAVSVVPVQ